MKYRVHAVRTVTRDGWTSIIQIPTFFLDGDVQGIRDQAHAERIARDICGHAVNNEVSCTAYMEDIDATEIGGVPMNWD